MRAPGRRGRRSLTPGDRGPRPGHPGGADVRSGLASLGPFFALEVVPAANAALVSPPWRVFAELLHSSAPLRARVEAVRAGLADAAGRPVEQISPRVAASTAQFGIVARLVAPLVGCFALTGSDPELSADRLRWQGRLDGAFPLALAPDGRAGASGGAAGPSPLAGSVVEAITVAVAARWAVSPITLWGNVGSAANTAAGLVAAARPELAPAARAAADALLGDPRVAGGGLRSGPRFRRRSCCLLYRAVDDRSSVCGDCVLERTPV